VVRLAIAAGVAPMTAIQMATINSAEAYRIDHLVGSISLGRIADILLVDSPESFGVQAVISEGVLVARDRRLIIPLAPPSRSPLLSSELSCPLTTQDDFHYKVKINQGIARVLSMDVKGPFVRQRRDVELKVCNGVILPDVAQDVALVSVLERFGKNGNRSLAFCSGWKLRKGAMATSCSPDDNNIVVMGVDAADMSLAVNHLITNGGGTVLVANGEVLAFLSLPVGGIVSDETPETVAEQEAVLTQVARDLGCELPEPLMYMSFLPITSIPDYAITDVGPVDVRALDTFDPVLELREG
jgi:adenine deaminase